MSQLQSWRMACRAVFKAVARTARVLFIILLIVIPAPFAQLLFALVQPHRRNQPAQVLKKKQE